MRRRLLAIIILTILILLATGIAHSFDYPPNDEGRPYAVPDSGETPLHAKSYKDCSDPDTVRIVHIIDDLETHGHIGKHIVIILDNVNFNDYSVEVDSASYVLVGQNRVVWTPTEDYATMYIWLTRTGCPIGTMTVREGSRIDALVYFAITYR